MARAVRRFGAAMLRRRALVFLLVALARFFIRSPGLKTQPIIYTEMPPNVSSPEAKTPSDDRHRIESQSFACSRRTKSDRPI